MRCVANFTLSRFLEKQFAGVKLRGYTVAGSEEVKQPAGVEYKNISEGLRRAEKYRSKEGLDVEGKGEEEKL